jgi:hypothetical protein
MAQINKSTDYFNTVLYTGNSTTGHAITGVGFQPDFVWTKGRSDADPNYVHDVVRTVSNRLNTAATTGEAGGLLSSFDADGFTISSTGDGNNGTGHTYASWNWLASNTTASNTDGSITSTVSANTTSGFSIVSYTGTGSNATVGHGLSSAPKMVIVKERDNANNWFVYHSSLGATKQLILQETDAEASFTATWNDTEPTSSVFSVGTNLGTNRSGGGLIAYCFAEKKGFSKFGSYTGNGNADGTFVYTGFKPAFVMVKRSNNTQGWYMLDNKRNTFNPEDKYLEANDSDAEATFTFCDFLSNGFKARVDNTGTGFNFSGDTYIYMAFAESPFVSSTGVPATAR